LTSFDRRAVMTGAFGVALAEGANASAESRSVPQPQFGPREAAIDFAERAASEKFYQWQVGTGMSFAGMKLARGRALHSRILAYTEVHQQVFGGYPTTAHIVSVTQLLSRETEFRYGRSLSAPFDACGCQRCFQALWSEARAIEIACPHEIASAMQRVAGSKIMNRDWVRPPAAAERAYCKFQEPIRRADGSLAPRSFTAPTADGRSDA
jgi:hypothetical protein